jgi:hypothetical protein
VLNICTTFALRKSARSLFRRITGPLASFLHFCFSSRRGQTCGAPSRPPAAAACKVSLYHLAVGGYSARESLQDKKPYFHLAETRIETRGASWILHYTHVLLFSRLLLIPTSHPTSSKMSALPELAGSAQTQLQIVPATDPTTPISTQLWPEPLDTPGLIPHHLKRSATASFPILEVLQRLLQRLRPQGSTGDLEKVLAIIGLYQAVRPVYNYLNDFFFWAFTVQVTVPESDPVAKEILAWMGAEVIRNSHTRSAMLVTGGLENMNNGFPHPMRFSSPPGHGNDRVDEEVSCVPPLGTRLFW